MLAPRKRILAETHLIAGSTNAQTDSFLIIHMDNI